MRVLVIEDDPDLNRQLTRALGDAGYAVDSATDGEEGHFLGDTEPYDVIVLDLGLPKLDGVTVLERWRRDGKDTPVLILTARDRWSEKVAGFDAGADDYLTKPFHTEELLALEPDLSPSLKGAVVSGGATMDPFLTCEAFAKRARIHGAHFKFGVDVTGLERVDGGGFRVHGSQDGRPATHDADIVLICTGWRANTGKRKPPEYHPASSI